PQKSQPMRRTLLQHHVMDDIPVLPTKSPAVLESGTFPSPLL
ncbi:hypothetical protein BVRB_043090, partial [Beta vulgaris subsp. vulgaris]